jgi:hypothetical protein
VDIPDLAFVHIDAPEVMERRLAIAGATDASAKRTRRGVFLEAANPVPLCRSGASFGIFALDGQYRILDIFQHLSLQFTVLTEQLFALEKTCCDRIKTYIS